MQGTRNAQNVAFSIYLKTFLAHLYKTIGRTIAVTSASVSALVSASAFVKVFA